jgi:hypothetical protein
MEIEYALLAVFHHGKFALSTIYTGCDESLEKVECQSVKVEKIVPSTLKIVNMQLVKI